MAGDGLLDQLFGPIVGGAFAHLGRAGQSKAAKFCYEVARKAQSPQATVVSRGAIMLPWPAWEDLTQRQQETWMGALADALQERKEG